MNLLRHREPKPTREQRRAEEAYYRAEAQVSRTMEAISAQLKSELAAETTDWTSLTGGGTAGALDIAPADRTKIRANCITLWQNDPTLGQVAMLLQSGTLGGGIGTPKAADSRVQKVVTRFWEDDDNQLAVFGREAQILLNLALLLEGERFYTLHTSEADDQVKVSDIAVGEITHIITHPENRRKAVMYRREFRPQEINLDTGVYKDATQKTVWYYRDWRYAPWLVEAEGRGPDKEADALFAKAGDRLQKDVTVYQVRTNTLGLRGVPEAHRMYDWAKAHARSVRSLVTLAKALAMFAWQRKVTTKSAAALKGMADQFATPPPGDAAVLAENQNVDTTPVGVGTGGMTNLLGASRETLLEATRPFGFGEHFYGSGANANLATATAMTMPAIWRIDDRQAIYRKVFDDFCQFAIKRTRGSSHAFVSLPQRVDTALDINMPPAQPQTPQGVGALLMALVPAVTGGLVDEQEAAYQAYLALGTDNIPEVMERQFPPETKLEGKAPEEEGGEGGGVLAVPVEPAAPPAIPPAPGAPPVVGGTATEALETRRQEAVSPPFEIRRELDALEVKFAAALQSRVILPWHGAIKRWLAGREEFPAEGALTSILRQKLLPNQKALRETLGEFTLRAGNIGGQGAVTAIGKGIAAAVGKRRQEAVGDPAAETLRDRLARGEEWNALAEGGIFVFNLRQPALLKALATRGTKITGEVTQTMLENLRDVLSTQFYEQGAGPMELSKSIDNIFPPTYANRAENIARTETVIAQGTVGHEAYVENGVEKKQWLALLDGKTRPEHAAAHGQVRGIDDAFDVGGEAMLHPGDPGASPENICQCRCDELPVIDDETDLPAQPWLGGYQPIERSL